MKERYKIVTPASFTHSVPSVQETSRTALILFLPQLAMLALTKSYRSLCMVGITLGAALVAAGIDTAFRKRPFSFSWNFLLEALLIGLFVPASCPYPWVFVVVSCTLLLARYAFGGFAQSWINPTAITIIVLYLFCGKFFPGFLFKLEYLQNSNTVPLLVRDGLIPLQGFDSPVSTFLNEKLLMRFGIRIPEGYLSLLWDMGGDIPAFRFNLLTLFSSIVLYSLNMMEPIVPMVYLFVYAVLVRSLGIYSYVGILGQGDVLLALLTSGTLVTAFFLLPWSGTMPLSRFGKFLYALCAAVLAMAINGFGTSPVGSMFVVLTVNALSPTIQFCEDSLHNLRLARKWRREP